MAVINTFDGYHTLQWHITHRCNLRCSHCYQEDYSRIMTGEELFTVLEKYRRFLESRRLYGHVNVTGGEPLSSPDFFPLIEEITRLGIRFSVLTNGTLITPAIARRIAALRPVFVQVSLDGCEGVHDSIRGAGSFRLALDGRVHQLVREMEGQIGGFDFARVILRYEDAYEAGDDETRSNCLRWLRGEYTTRTEAKQALRVGSIIDDDNWFDYLKLLCAFVRAIGYKGLAVYLDECVNLYKIPNRLSRENNYEKLLSMFNDCLQGRSPGMTMVLGGTPQFLEDPRRGLYSYEALRSRLADGRFAQNAKGYKNLLAPVIRLRRMSDNELLALIERVTILYGQYHGCEPRITEEEKQRFLLRCLDRAGADEMITPREILREYLTVLDLLLQNPDAAFADIVGGVDPTPAAGGSAEAEKDDFFDLPELKI